MVGHGANFHADLRDLRHPLLMLEALEQGASLKTVIASDLRIEGGHGLVVSGPNAGGKTVALECFGLAAWMVRSGVPIPAAEGSIVGWFGAALAIVTIAYSMLEPGGPFIGLARVTVLLLAAAACASAGDAVRREEHRAATTRR